MTNAKPSRVGVWVGLLFAIFTLSASSTTARAGGGQVLPANADPKGYSLPEAAQATAVFNTGGTAAPNVPFQILSGGAGNYTVKPGTMLYVPVFFADDSGTPDPAPFPTHLSDQGVDADYLINAIDAFTGLDDVEALFIEVDGKVTILGDDSVSGVTTPTLPDGGGSHYIVSAAFLTPLTPGKHTVVVGAVLSDGTQVGPPGYTVTVR